MSWGFLWSLDIKNIRILKSTFEFLKEHSWKRKWYSVEVYRINFSLFNHSVHFYQPSVSVSIPYDCFIAKYKVFVIMMEENNDIFLAGGDVLVYLAVPMHKKYFTNLFGAIHLVRTYLRINFSTLLSLVSICTHLE